MIALLRIIWGADSGLWTVAGQDDKPAFPDRQGFATRDDALREIESLARTTGGIVSTIRYLDPPEFRGDVLVGFPEEQISFEDEMKAAEAAANV